MPPRQSRVRSAKAPKWAGPDPKDRMQPRPRKGAQQPSGLSAEGGSDPRGQMRRTGKADWGSEEPRPARTPARTPGERGPGEFAVDRGAAPKGRGESGMPKSCWQKTAGKRRVEEKRRREGRARNRPEEPRISRATEAGGTRPRATTTPTSERGSGAPARRWAAQRARRGHRGSEAAADCRAARPDERACATTGTARLPRGLPAAGM